MNKYSSKSAQGGFTLIELIVVIVILGILAATALPKFADLGADARLASMKAAKGAVSSASAMIHAKALVANKTTGEMDMEGTKVTLINGYPAVTDKDDFAAAAGLNASDYDFSAPLTDNNTKMTIKVKGAADTSKCAFTYTQATATAAPVIADVSTVDCK